LKDKLIQELDNYDCASLFEIAKKRIKVLNQRLDRLIPENDIHTVLQEKRTYDIEIIEE